MLRVSLFFGIGILLPLAMSIVICLIGIANANAFEINTATVNHPKGSSHFDLDYYIIFDEWTR